MAGTPARRDLVSIGEAAALIARSERHLRRLVAERRVRFYKVGRSIRFDVADLEALLDAAVVEPVGVPGLKSGR